MTTNPSDSYEALVGGTLASNDDKHIRIDICEAVGEASELTAGEATPAHRRVVSQDITSEKSSRTNITRGDVARVFRESKTHGRVTREEIARVKQMHDKISEGVEFTFNYCTLLIVASVVAGLGLASDSTTTVISSMLLSPIMGPVIGMAYGLVIWDLDLIKRSARNECASILVCIFFGVIISICISWTEMAESWATDEMLSRGTPQTLFVGIPIAFFSGLGVAVSVLDESTSSLVGVAISASLLPPAVNAGMLWMFAGMVKVGNREFANSDEDFVGMGLISLWLTVANVIVVWIGAALMFRVKEVLPVKKKIFWDDLKIARRIYQKRAYMEDDSEIANATFGDSDPPSPLSQRKNPKNPDEGVDGMDIERGV